MPIWLLQALNVGFLIFHTSLVLFNAVGWAWRRTRRIHLVTVGLTLISWTVMGLWKGVGYCICTDWHWQIRHALGLRDPDSSYIHFLVRVTTGWSAPDAWVNAVTGSVFLGVVVLMVALNVRDFRDRRRRAPS